MFVLGRRCPGLPQSTYSTGRYLRLGHNTSSSTLRILILSDHSRKITTVPHDLPAIGTRPLKPRNLVLCFDGTTNIYDDHNTNVVKLFSLLEKRNPSEQMVYYQPGVGTYTPPGILMPITIAVAKVMDQSIALYLDKHVMGGYEFLMKHYNDGDRICLFGFSRGAYTARALAGMLNKVGLLPPDNIEQIPFAYSMYKRNDAAGFKASAGFKKVFCRTVRIEFMGVWDTVSSVGLLWPRHLPFTASNSIVKRFRHAVSLDEHRAKFKQNVWHVRAPSAAEASRDPEHGTPIAGEITSGIPAPPSTTLSKVSQKSDPALAPDLQATISTPPTQQDPVVNVVEVPGSEQTDLPSSALTRPENRGEDQEGSNGKSCREPTLAHSIHSSSAASALKFDLSRQAACPIKNEPSVETAREPEKKTSLDADVTQWINSHEPERHTAQMSGAVLSEEAWEKCHKLEDRLKETDTDVLEVRFAGCHSDVGGGSEPNNAQYSLSNIPLRWMIKQIVLAQCGIQFNHSALKDMHISLGMLDFGGESPSATSSYGPDAAAVKEAREREKLDALSPMHDALKNPLWWPLEFFPLVHSYQDEGGKWYRSLRLNIFRPRHARKTLGNIKLHKSVQYRQENSDYTPRAKLDGTIEYVD